MTKIAEWYDDFVKEQIKKGINKRHLEINKRILNKTNNLTVQTILEIGCGIGSQTELLNKYFSNAQITAIDISEKSIEYAKEKNKKNDNIRFETRDIINNPIGRKFDLIVLADVIEHIPLELHNSLFKVLNESISNLGIICINIPSPAYLDHLTKTCPDTLQVVDQPICSELVLKSIQKTDLYIDFLEHYSVWISEGDYQFFTLKKRSTSFSGNLFNERTLMSRIHSFYIRRIRWRWH